MIKQLNEAEAGAVNGAGWRGYLVGYVGATLAGADHETADAVGDAASAAEDALS